MSLLSFCTYFIFLFCIIFFCFFFFFQAEDGIRDKLVTGVQTCALPISFNCYLHNEHHSLRIPPTAVGGCVQLLPTQRTRSEERRVGKECRSRWSPYH